jgi:hypothetical protein
MHAHVSWPRSTTCGVGGVKNAHVTLSASEPLEEFAKDGPGEVLASGQSVLVGGIKELGILLAPHRSPVGPDVEDTRPQSVPRQVVGQPVGKEGFAASGQPDHDEQELAALTLEGMATPSVFVIPRFVIVGLLVLLARRELLQRRKLAKNVAGREP